MSQNPTNNLNRDASILHPGLEFIALQPGIDLDVHGRKRHTPAGAVGVLTYRPAPSSWRVEFPNGATFIVSDAELRNRNQWLPTSTTSLRASLLRIDYFHNEREMALLDEPVVSEVADIASRAKELATLLDKHQEIMHDPRAD